MPHLLISIIIMGPVLGRLLFMIDSHDCAENGSVFSYDALRALIGVFLRKIYASGFRGWLLLCLLTNVYECLLCTVSVYGRYCC